MKPAQASAKPTAKGATPVGCPVVGGDRDHHEDQDEGHEDLHQQRPEIPDVLRGNVAVTLAISRAAAPWRSPTRSPTTRCTAFEGFYSSRGRRRAVGTSSL